MNPFVLLAIILLYFGLLMFVAWRTGKNSNNDSFFIGNRNSNWVLVAFGMIGTSLSGVTFVSVPGAVGTDKFQYLQVTVGYLLGYLSIAYVLLPLYYRLKLTSIYGYLRERMGPNAYKSGAWIFIVSRLVGATARLYLVINILQVAILDSLRIPFVVTALAILVMIILYTYEGGVKTIVYTDTLQTTAMLAGLIICCGYILHNLNISLPESFRTMEKENLLQVWNTDVFSKSFFLKQIIAGAFITITMTGIDQEMMQKSLSVSKLKDSQKNMVTLGIILLGVIALFLFLGGLLHLFKTAHGITAEGDSLFPVAALQYMPPAISIIFLIALISALFPSADGALTALTSSFCIDIVGLKEKDWSPAKREKFRKTVHLVIAALFLGMVLIFKLKDDKSMIGLILKMAGFTYGPLLGLFAFGILTRFQVKDRWVPLVCLAGPVVCFFIDKFQSSLFGHFQIGLELLVLNGLLTFLGLWLIKKRNTNTVSSAQNLPAEP